MHPEKSSKIFNKIANHNPELVVSSLGPIGHKLMALFDSLGNHPEADSYFFEDCDLSICDLLDLADYAKKSGMSFFARHIPVLAEAQASETLKKSRVPSGNGSQARFLRKPIKEASRATRRIQKVQSKSFFLSAYKLWSTIPSDFCVFKDVPSNRSLDEDGAVDKFRSMGCRNLACSVEDLCDRFKAPQAVYGYKRLNLLDACLVLAKVNGADLTGNHENPSIHIRSPEGRIEYEPIVIPIHYLDDIPENVIDSIEKAEHNISIYFDSVFDNYVVIAPVDESKDANAKGRFVLSSRFQSVVLGERDGKCYFICEWNRVNYNNP